MPDDELDEYADEVPLSYGFASSDVGPDAEPPAIYLPGRGGWTRHDLTLPRRPIGFTAARRPGPHSQERPLCD